MHALLRRPRRRVRTLGSILLLPALVAGIALTSSGSTDRASAAPGDACGKTLRKADGGAWRCSFVDDFNASRLDSRKWLVAETKWSGFRVGSTCFKPGNAAVNRGTLRLTTRKENRYFLCRSIMGAFRTRYSGAHLTTTGRFQQTYGRFEIRARLPEGPAGLRAAFWMFPAKPTYGGWPRSGEIDVAEWWSVDEKLVMPSLHYGGRQPSLDSGQGCRVADQTAFHRYTLVWKPRVMQFQIDGKTCFQRSWRPNRPLLAPQPFDKPFGLVLNMAVDYPIGGNRVSSTTPLPATFEIDYVKAWR